MSSPNASLSLPERTRGERVALTPFATPSPGALDAEQVRSACTAPNTKNSYRSYIKGILAWIHETQESPNDFVEEDGSINLSVFIPAHFDAFLLHKMNGGGLKVSTLSGYRSALKDVYSQKRLDLPSEYLDDLKTFFRGLKRIEADHDQAGCQRKPGKELLTFSLYSELAKRIIALNDNGFAHLFLLSQWNLMCRSKSVETLQRAQGPRHIYANPAQPSCCWILALGVYLASNPTLQTGKLFPGSNQKSRFCKVLSKLLEGLTGQKFYGTHSIRKGVATYASSGSTGGPSIVSVCLRCGWSLGGVQDRYFRYEAAGDQYMGRVVAGLPQNSSQFAVLPPHFEDPRDVFVLDAGVAPLLSVYCGACGVFEKPSRAKHPLWSSYVFLYPEVLARLRGSLLTEGSSWMRPTGIPPHIELFQQHAETHTALRQLPDVLLDGFGSTIRALLEEAGLWRSQDSGREEASPQYPSSTTYYWPSDGRFHRVPNDFKFPQLDALGVWRLWWLGNPAAGFPPFRALHASDFAASNRKMYSEWSGGGRSPLSPRDGKHGVKPSAHPHKQRLDRAVTTLRRIREAIHDANPDARSVAFRHRKREKQQK
ncbi:hypothetical protein ON010_g3645 [Phytophthora cinnamomi]|nr:hypothetical protein ON010_g3645 [Phytophthora cinnamomi]